MDFTDYTEKQLISTPVIAVKRRVFIVLYFRKKRIDIKHQRIIETAYPLLGRGQGVGLLF
jgi:hypothetical protein